jgi:hypothetical protein
MGVPFACRLTPAEGVQSLDHAGSASVWSLKGTTRPAIKQCQRPSLPSDSATILSRPESSGRQRSYSAGERGTLLMVSVAPPFRRTLKLSWSRASSRDQRTPKDLGGCDNEYWPTPPVSDLLSWS